MYFGMLLTGQYFNTIFHTQHIVDKTLKKKRESEREIPNFHINQQVEFCHPV
jgi:hypothetical protein